MAKHIFRWSISVFALIAVLVHAFVPSIAVDATTALLLFVAAVPWLGLLFKSVELPGGLKVEYRDLEEATDKARSSGLIEATSANPPTPLYAEMAIKDPNLALAGLRIALEKEMVALAERHGIERGRKSIGQLSRELTDLRVFGVGAHLSLMDLTHLLNNAVHGAKVDASAVEWALTSGQELLSSLRAK